MKPQIAILLILTVAVSSYPHLQFLEQSDPGLLEYLYSLGNYIKYIQYAYTAQTLSPSRPNFINVVNPLANKYKYDELINFIYNTATENNISKDVLIRRNDETFSPRRYDYLYQLPIKTLHKYALASELLDRERNVYTELPIDDIDFIRTLSTADLFEYITDRLAVYPITLTYKDFEDLSCRFGIQNLDI